MPSFASKIRYILETPLIVNCKIVVSHKQNFVEFCIFDFDKDIEIQL